MVCVLQVKRRKGKDNIMSKGIKQQYHGTRHLLIPNRLLGPKDIEAINYRLDPEASPKDMGKNDIDTEIMVVS